MRDGSQRDRFASRSQRLRRGLIAAWLASGAACSDAATGPASSAAQAADQADGAASETDVSAVATDAMATATDVTATADADLAETDAADAPDADAAVDTPTETDTTAETDITAETDAAPDPGLQPPFPLVFAHGFFGFNDFAGAGFIDYFYHVKDNLEKQGEKLAFFPAVDPFESSEVRSAALWAQIEVIRAQTGKKRVVLIGHSQGGLDARIIAAKHPEAVAALLTVATPYSGSPVADTVLFLAPGPLSKGIVEALGGLIGGVINPESNNSLMAALGQLSSKQAAALEAAYPFPPDLPVWSIAGRSLYAGKSGPCASSAAPPFITKWDGETDPVNALLLACTAAMVGDVNDGLVPAESAKRGVFLGCIPADHLDQIGHILGQPPGLFNKFDYKLFWSDVVGWLRGKGY